MFLPVAHFFRKLLTLTGLAVDNVSEGVSTREHVCLLQLVLHYVYLGGHTFTKGAEPGRHELKLNLEHLLADNCWDVDLNLKEEHVVALDGLADLKEVLLPTTVVVIDQEAPRVPLVLRTVEHLVLDEGGLACLHGRTVDILRTACLFGHVLNSCQVFEGWRLRVRTEHPREPGTPVFLFWHLCKLDVITKPNRVLSAFPHNTPHLLPFLLFLSFLVFYCFFNLNVVLADPRLIAENLFF